MKDLAYFMDTSFYDNKISTTTEKSFFISVGGYENEIFTSIVDATNWIISFYGKSRDSFEKIFNFLDNLVSDYNDPDLALTISKK